MFVEGGLMVVESTVTERSTKLPMLSPFWALKTSIGAPCMLSVRRKGQRDAARGKSGDRHGRGQGHRRRHRGGVRPGRGHGRCPGPRRGRGGEGSSGCGGG